MKFSLLIKRERRYQMFAVGVIVGFGIAWYASASRR